MHSLRAQAQARRRAAPELAREGLPSAHAGKTQNPAYRSCPMSDHPRACGENLSGFLFNPINHGSPPRVRGKLTYYKAGKEQHRITPACAGKTDLFYGGEGATPDHPRVCGENSGRTSIASHWSESPPRVRGKRLFVHPLFSPSRITPACAGKTPAPRRALPSLPDHPRVCGENSLKPFVSKRRVGSPPRVRGKHKCS